MTELKETAHRLGFQDASVGLGDTPAGAQFLSQYFEFFIASTDKESESISHLPFQSLDHLEGLTSWRGTPAERAELTQDLQDLGFSTIQELQKIPFIMWQTRWGDLGSQIYKKISGLETVPFKPLIPKTPLISFEHLSFALSSRTLLLKHLRPKLYELLLRLEAAHAALDRLNITLWCEFDSNQHVITLEPSMKDRDLEHLMSLVSERLERVDLCNPISNYEIEVIQISKPVSQLDFFESQNIKDEQILNQLQGLFMDHQISCGYLQLHPEILPEECSSLSQKEHPLNDTPPQTYFDFARADEHKEFPMLSQSLSFAPRPTRILKSPLPLDSESIKRLSFLTKISDPIERFSLPWKGVARDYWIALTKSHECLWVFKDLQSESFYLHGYFD